MDNERVKKLIRELIIEIGEDPTREGLCNTPERIASAYKEIFSGYDSNSELSVQFSEDSESVVIRDIQFYSMCEHHMLPFFGKCHIAYLPRNKVIGLSKIPRVVEVFSRRIQVQERLTNQIAKTLSDKLNPLGDRVNVEATHLCISMRGVEKQNSYAITSSLRGEFEQDSKTRQEFMGFLRLNREPFV